jgi:hypothetical protein
VAAASVSGIERCGYWIPAFAGMTIEDAGACLIAALVISISQQKFAGNFAQRVGVFSLDRTSSPNRSKTGNPQKGVM